MFQTHFLGYKHFYLLRVRRELEQELHLIEERYDILQDLFTHKKIRSRKHRKALMAWIGKIGAFLFDITTEDEIVDIHQAIENMQDKEEKIIKISEKLIGLAKFNELRIGNMTDNIRDAKMNIAILKQKVKNIKTEERKTAFYLAKQMLYYSIHEFQVTFQGIVKTIYKGLDILITEITSIIHGKLGPGFLMPHELLGILKRISTLIPRKLTVPEITVNGEILGLYELMDTNFIRIKDTNNIAIHIPLIDRSNTLQLYDIITYPIPISKKGTSYRLVEIPKGKLFAISPNMEKLIITMPQEVKKCKQWKGISLCHMNEKMETNEKLQICIAEIVSMGTNICTKYKTKISAEKYEDQFINIEGDKWLYALSESK